MEKCEKFEITRIHRLEGESKLKAFVDVTLAGFEIRGLRVVDGQNGLFVGMPRSQGKDGRWYPTVSALSKEVQQELSEAVLEAYQQQ